MAWSQEHLDGRADVLGAAHYLGVAGDAPPGNFLAPMSAEELWGMWALVCGLAQTVDGDTAAFLAGLDDAGGRDPASAPTAGLHPE